MRVQSDGASAEFGGVVAEFVRGIEVAVPHVLLGVVFLVVAYVVIRVVLAVVRGVLQGVYAERDVLVVDLWVTVVGVFLWFGAALAFFKIVGLGGVSAGLGTASGFVGLGVAFALKEMIADTVAGVYLIRDPDFNEGDVVETAGETGEILAVDLRKTRLRSTEGDLVVVANRDVEKRWRQEAAGAVSAESEQATGE